MPWNEISLDDFGTQESDLAAILEADRRKKFDITSAPLLRFTLITLPSGKHKLVVTHHHIIMDGWSLGLVLGELLDCRGSEQAYAPATPEARGFRDFLDWLARHDRKASSQAWSTYLRGIEPSLVSRDPEDIVIGSMGSSTSSNSLRT